MQSTLDGGTKTKKVVLVFLQCNYRSALALIAQPKAKVYGPSMDVYQSKTVCALKWAFGFPTPNRVFRLRHHDGTIKPTAPQSTDIGCHCARVIATIDPVLISTPLENKHFQKEHHRASFKPRWSVTAGPAILCRLSVGSKGLYAVKKYGNIAGTKSGRCLDHQRWDCARAPLYHDQGTSRLG